MTILENKWSKLLLIVLILAAGYFSLGEPSTSYAQEISFTNNSDAGNYYIQRNTRKLFGFILIGLSIFGAVKGWRRAVVLGCFLTFLGLASFGLFTYGRMIAAWLNSADTKLIPTIAFFVGGILYIRMLHKIYALMNAFLKEQLYKK